MGELAQGVPPLSEVTTILRITAVTVAGLTVYDMAKAIDKEMRIDDIVLVSKTKEPA